MNWDWNQLWHWPAANASVDIWGVQLLIVALVTVSINFIVMRAIDVLDHLTQKTDTLWDDALLEAARIPLRLVFWVIGLSVVSELLQKVTESALFDLAAPVRRIAFIAILAIFLIRFIRFTEKNLIDPSRLRKPMDESTAAAMAKLLRVSVLIIATLIILQTLGYSISGVLAFGGIGGMAVAFAARDLLANFFGGMMVYLDKPFRVGDWVRSPDRSIEGVVEDIGWRLTCIRTFDQRPLYIPNAMFTTIVLENPSRMLNRRIYETVCIRHQDWQKMPDIVQAVKALLQAHPDLETDSRTLIVNFDSYGASHIEFFIYTFTQTTQWVPYHEIKQDVLMKILTLIHEHGARLAYPTRTLHVTNTNPDHPATGLEATPEETDNHASS